MAGLTVTLETAKGTLLNSQIGIQTASHNISNADSKTYARQRLITVTNPAYNSSAGWIGTGARVAEVVQQRDQYLDRRLARSIGAEAQSQSLSSQLTITQSRLATDSNSGISGALGSFWDSWDALVQNPTGTAQQTEVTTAAQGLVDAIHSTAEDLTTQADTDIPDQISDGLTQAKDLMDQIANYNKEIARSEYPGHTANDLRDSRMAAVQELSKLLPIQYTETSNGAINISVSDGTTSANLVFEDQVGSLSYDSTAGPNAPITYTGYDGTAVSPTTTQASGGSLTGLLKAREDIHGYLTQLDTFTASLAQEVNSRFNQPPGSKDVFTGTTASTIATVDGFMSGQDATVLGTAASSVAQLQDSDVTFSDGTTAKLGEYLGNIQQQVGLDNSEALDDMDFQKALQTELFSQQQAVSGVSIDEEMVDILKHQQVFQAAAKIIQQTGELMNTVIEMV